MLFKHFFFDKRNFYETESMNFCVCYFVAIPFAFKMIKSKKAERKNLPKKLYASC